MMMKLTLMEKHMSGCSAMELFRDEHGEVTLTVYGMEGGSQFDFELDESDLEILSIMIERARRKTQEGSGNE